jgi:hypothetical protein
MPLTSATEQSLRRVFLEGFAARDIAEPLASFDATTDIQPVREFMVRRPLSVVGVRRDGLVTGYVQQGNLDDRPLGEQAVPLTEALIITTLADLREVILGLRERPFLLVAVLGQVVGVIMRDDLEKAPVRMWMFGMVTLLEMRLTRLIREFCLGDSWHSYLSGSRVAKARALHAERTRRNQDLDLIDCLQFGDKGQILARSETLRSKVQFGSRGQVEKAVKNLERLRNNLAHAQDIVSENWDVIVELAEDLDSIIKEPEHLPARNSHTPYD